MWKKRRGVSITLNDNQSTVDYRQKRDSNPSSYLSLSILLSVYLSLSLSSLNRSMYRIHVKPPTPPSSFTPLLSLPTSLSREHEKKTALHRRNEGITNDAYWICHTQIWSISAEASAGLHCTLITSYEATYHGSYWIRECRVNLYTSPMTIN